MTTAPHRMRVLRPATIAEALELATEPGARLVASGTALQLDWAKGAAQPRMLVALDRIAGLGDVSMAVGKVRIGALTTLGALERDAAILSALPLLHAAIRSTAGPSVRTLATIGGNVAGRAGCLLPALLALDAEVIVSDGSGEMTLPLTDWLSGQAHEPQIVTAIVVPLPASGSLWTHRKIGLRAAFTPGVISVAASLCCTGGRIASARLAVGSGLVEPARLHQAEARLTGSELAGVDWSGLHDAIVQETVAPDDAFRSARYRRRVAANALVHGLGGALPHSGRVKTAAVATQPEPLAGEIRLTRESAGARWHVRPDGPPKIAGRLEYLTDPREPGMLVARILRAGVPHARILSIDISRAEALPGVAAVVTHSDIAGSNAFGIVVQDQPAFCFDKVRYAGDAVAAVAAKDAETAARALDLIDVCYELLPTVCDPQSALLAGAEPIHSTGNLQRRLEFRRGDTAEAFRRAAHVVEATYVTPRQMHGFMETEGGFARVEEDGTLTVCAGGQHGSRDRLQLSRILGMPEERIRVVTSPTGGAFGGKDELTVQPALALLALKTGRPVRIQLDRAESVLAGTKRNPMRIRMRTACDRDGLLVAQEVDLLADAGAYASLGPGVMETALEHACGPYLVPNVQTEGRLAYTNNGVCGAFRGFGANQMSYAIECQMDRLAGMCGLDRFEIRRRNMRRPGSRGYLGQHVAPSERLLEMLQTAEADPIWRQQRGLSDDGTELIGTGMAMNYQGNGLGTLPPDPGGGALRLAPDGAIEALYGLDEMGQGLLTSVRSAVATALGCGREDVRPVTGDTGRAPDSGSTTASRGTYVAWRVAESTAPAFGAAICKAAGRLLGREAEALAIVPGGVAERGSNSGEILLTFAEIARSMPEGSLPSVETTFEFPKSDYIDGNARLIFAFGATLARVAVSRITGQVRVLDLHQHTAAGPMLDLAAYLGQIEGGGVQGLGFTLSEDALMQDGRLLTTNLDTYMLPGIADAPQTLASFALEDLDEGDPFGPRGAGELGIGAVTPAIANAVADATGFWPETTPFNPERLLDVVGAAA
ncbi:molybdopterin cofactor-binding domain-containing protein [Mesorhizobium australicum]|uniref:Xanthine dehydrogenase, molybdenum binding subunit apoprotein n=1 Tax=Mesorhizobium australicum TaxID=536018 RepID=A0A1X7PNZ3_9HYPH|nr:molybdopterin cofactor-binding domain-containing protein [Mesorhizobium australicum]SMH53653.1 xanthine dehydrogenase, molybdenum binding subunit apoprotein [Mesorhizobium australicum]